MAKTYTAIKYRIYPTSEQKILFQKTFGCCRYVYNTMLMIQKELYDRNGMFFGKYDAFKIMTSELKSRCDFLREVDSLALMNSVFNLDDAFQGFFNHEADYPRFKSSKNKNQSYTTSMVSDNIQLNERTIKLPKAGTVKTKIHRQPQPDWKIKSATVSTDTTGSYYCSILFEYDEDVDVLPINSIKDCIGLDFSEGDMFADSNGNRGNIPKFCKNYHKRLLREQHKLSRMIESNITDYKVVGNKRYPVYKKPLSECRNIQKQRHKIAVIHKHISDQRKDFLHKISNQITNDYKLICIEDISIRNMMLKKQDDVTGKHRINRNTLNNGWNLFTSMIMYKAHRKGKTVIKVDKYFPSSQLCNCCGYRNPLTKDISIKQWICPSCSTSHDRDINAAVNIRNEGYRLYKTQIV